MFPRALDAEFRRFSVGPFFQVAADVEAHGIGTHTGFRVDEVALEFPDVVGVFSDEFIELVFHKSSTVVIQGVFRAWGEGGPAFEFHVEVSDLFTETAFYFL